jgi:hypothetical protein
MGRRTNVLLGLCGALAIVGVAAVVLMSVDARAIGRTDPKRAANYRLPWFNFAETYTDGQVLGIATGSTRSEAIDAAKHAGLIVEPSGWGDNRADGADLYETTELLTTMLRQPYLNFYDPKDTKRGLTISFRDNRVASVEVFYINFEAI